jgi:L-serine dehydratase
MKSANNNIILLNITNEAGAIMKSLTELYKIGSGPSSSHTMGPEKAARIFKSENPDADRYKVILYGSLARPARAT